MHEEVKGNFAPPPPVTGQAGSAQGGIPHQSPIQGTATRYVA